MLKLLFVEDEPEVIEAIVDSLRSECDCRVKDFQTAEAEIHSFGPDIVVLDILAGGSSADADPTGKSTYETIWNQRFCPIIVYSASPELLSDSSPEHPFVTFVRKGMGSDKILKESLERFRPHVEAIRDAEGRMRSEYSLCLREVAPDAFRYFNTDEARRDAILRAARRRLAALMDDLSRHNERLQGWEQYLCPPIGSDLQLGDILRAKESSADSPSSFFVVLTPSCDLASGNERQPKVADVLVAACDPILDGIKATSLGNLGRGKLSERLKSNLLTQGFLDGVIPLPKLEGRIPSMAANVKKLKLIPLSHITATSGEYVRVASIDSPFRELIAWAYSQTACRPGLPDRDFDAWRDEIVAVYDQVQGAAS